MILSTNKTKPQGTVKRTIRINPKDLPFLEKLATEKGWEIDNVNDSIKYLKSIPRKNYSEQELEEINREIVEEIKAYRHGN